MISSSDKLNRGRWNAGEVQGPVVFPRIPTNVVLIFGTGSRLGDKQVDLAHLERRMKSA